MSLLAYDWSYFWVDCLNTRSVGKFESFNLPLHLGGRAFVRLLRLQNLLQWHTQRFISNCPFQDTHQATVLYAIRKNSMEQTRVARMLPSQERE